MPGGNKSLYSFQAFFDDDDDDDDGDVMTMHAMQCNAMQCNAII